MWAGEQQPYITLEAWHPILGFKIRFNLHTWNQKLMLQSRLLFIRYQQLLTDIHQCYLDQRELLLGPSITCTVTELTSQNNRDHCALVSFCLLWFNVKPSLKLFWHARNYTWVNKFWSPYQQTYRLFQLWQISLSN